jgi:hypothetical protein
VVRTRELGLKVVRALKARVLPRRTHYWEYRGRMEVVSGFLRSEAAPGSTVLDVGGAPGDNLLRRFGVGEVTTLDLDPGADIVASADAIPRPDESFDYVTCIDTMEHVPAERRSAVLRELIRVARRAVVVVAPHDTPENREAERIVLGYVRAPFLVEHAQHGLWNVGAAEQDLAELRDAGRIARFERRELDDLLLWACLMTEDYADSSEVYERLRHLDHRFHPRRAALLVWKR